MKRVILISVVLVFLLFSCATGKTLERVETNMVEVEAPIETEEEGKDEVIIPLLEEEEEKEEEDLSNLELFYSEGTFHDFKNQEEVEIREVLPQEKESETINEAKTESKDEEKEVNILTYVLISVFALLALVFMVIILSINRNRKRKALERDEIWPEEEEYSSLLEILEDEDTQS